MPTNVTPQYAAAERNYQKASTTAEKLKWLQVMLREVPKHKGTETLRKEIKTKISKLKEKLLKEKETKKKGFSLAIKKEGAAQIVLVGPPNTGKTSLLNFLTQAHYLVASYPFTTTQPNLGTLNYQGVKLQVVDLPPLIEGAALKQAPYLAIVRNADLVLFVIDHLKQLPSLLKEFSQSQIILNKTPPPLKIKKEVKGGLTFVGEKLIKDNLEEIKEILRKHNLTKASIEIFGPVKKEDFLEALKEGVVYLPALVVLNKQKQEGKIFVWQEFEVIPLSLYQKKNLELLLQKIWQKLNLIKVYTKEIGKKPSLQEPLALKKNSLIKDLAYSLHKDFLKKFAYAKVWGKSAHHPGQKVGLDHQLKDGDIVEIHLKK